MNAKKIMGAVLVALLAAALFVGAGFAGATTEDDLGTVFVYQNTSYTGSWTGTAGTVEFVNGVIESLPAPGYYSNGSAKIYVSYPTAAISAIANSSGYYYKVIGGVLYINDEVRMNVSVQAPAKVAVRDILITYPDGTQMSAFEVLGAGAYAKLITKPSEFLNGTVNVALSNDNLTTLLDGQTGEFKVQALFAKIGQKDAQGQIITQAVSGVNEDEHQLVSYTPDQYLIAQDIYTFTVVDEEEDVTISASVDKVLKGNTFTVTITGEPGEEYTIGAKDGKTVNIISAGGYIINTTSKKFQMPSSGTITVYMNTTATDEITITVNGDKAEVTIEILKPTLTATLGATSYYIGDEIEVTLTTDGVLAKNYVFNITGTNFNETEIEDAELDKDVWKLPTATVNDSGKMLDVGTYTIKIYSADGTKTLLATLPVALKQPFISIIEAPEVIVQGDKAEFFINAEAAENITAYFFGTNYFLASGLIGATKDVSNQFGVKLLAEDTANMSAGQYFAVFQHPMYDGAFNIYPESGKFYLNTSGNAGNLAINAQPQGEKGTFLFDVKDRQTANAAQALCDALDSQNIDDMYVKASFFIVGEDESFTLSEIPTSVAQGETFTISGVSTANAGNTVTVEMISTAFAAVPKETVGSAAFILVTTEVTDDGTWEITMDTSDLNVDEYSLKVAVTNQDGKSETWKNVKINVVEGAETPDTPDTPDVPDTPDTPDTPTEPETPGFGALAALAGLGAVAVLLLRRE